MEKSNECFFDHEKLNVYQNSLDFIVWSNSLIKEIKNNTSDHLERASDSIVLNIAEGNGKYTPRDRCKYFDISRGSALESAGCLDILFAKSLINSVSQKEGEKNIKRNCEYVGWTD